MFMSILNGLCSSSLEKKSYEFYQNWLHADPYPHQPNNVLYTLRRIYE